MGKRWMTSKWILCDLAILIVRLVDDESASFPPVSFMCSKSIDRHLDKFPLASSTRSNSPISLLHPPPSPAASFSSSRPCASFFTSSLNSTRFTCTRRHDEIHKRPCEIRVRRKSSKGEAKGQVWMHVTHNESESLFWVFAPITRQPVKNYPPLIALAI